MMDCEGGIDDNCVFDFFNRLLMDPEVALTFTHGHFNYVFFASSDVIPCKAAPDAELSIPHSILQPQYTDNPQNICEGVIIECIPKLQ